MLITKLSLAVQRKQMKIATSRGSPKLVQMAAWRPIRHMIGRQYMKAYFKIFLISTPEEHQDDRNVLYYL